MSDYKFNHDTGRWEQRRLSKEELRDGMIMDCGCIGLILFVVVIISCIVRAING